MEEGEPSANRNGLCGLADVPEGPAAVLSVSISSPALASPQSSLASYSPTLWT